MIKITLFAFLLATSAAQAQTGPVFQSGGVTPGHIAVWATNGVIKDGILPTPTTGAIPITGTACPPISPASASQFELFGNTTNGTLNYYYSGCNQIAALNLAQTWTAAQIIPNIYGGSATNSTLTLYSTSNGSPSGDSIVLNASTNVLDGATNILEASGNPVIETAVNAAGSGTYLKCYAGNASGFQNVECDVVTSAQWAGFSMRFIGGGSGASGVPVFAIHAPDDNYDVAIFCLYDATVLNTDHNRMCQAAPSSISASYTLIWPSAAPSLSNAPLVGASSGALSWGSTIAVAAVTGASGLTLNANTGQAVALDINNTEIAQAVSTGFYPGANNSFLLGASGSTWSGLYVTLSNTATTSAVCVNTSTWAFSYDGTLGTCNTSDERLKTFDGPITDSLAKLVALSQTDKFGYFHAKGTIGLEKLGDGEKIGIGAQTLDRFFPELVAQGSDGYYSAAYDKLTVPLINAVAELKADNDALKAEIESLGKRASQ